MINFINDKNTVITDVLAIYVITTIENISYIEQATRIQIIIFVTSG